MPPSSQTTQVVAYRQAPRDVIVRSWPLGQGNRQAWGLLAVTTGVCLVLGTWSGSLATGLVLGATLLLAGWRLLLPIEFELSAMGITRTTFWSTRRIPWSVIGRVQRRTHGVAFYQSVEPVALESLHALYVPFGKQEAELLALLDYYLSGRANHHSTNHGTTLP